MLRKTLKNIRDKLFSIYETKKLGNKKFIIVTNNCWGFELYTSIRREYNTPFVGLFVMPECYLRFLENFDECINTEMAFTDSSRYGKPDKHYPVGLLPKGIEIHFLHYSSREEALTKWNRRITRLRTERADGAGLYFKLCDAGDCTAEHLARFHKLPFENKISLGLQKFSAPTHIDLPEMREQSSGKLLDGAKLFKRRYHYFDITDWILFGRVSHSPVSRLFALLP